MSEISDRIKLLADNEGLSIRRLEHLIGCSNGVLARAIQKKTDINSVWVSKIIINFSRYNAEWLLTGEGEMLKGTDPTSKEDHKKNRVYDYIMEQNAQLFEQLKVKDQQLNEMIQTYHKLLEREKGGGVAHPGNDAKCADAG